MTKRERAEEALADNYQAWGATISVRKGEKLGSS